MFKLIILVAGLAIGFSAGLWYGVHHPSEAANLSAAEEQQVMQQTQAMRDKIHQLMSKHGIAGSGIGANLVDSSPAVDPDLKELDQKAQDQLDMLKKKLGQ
jgi:hypothetical protein